MCIYFKHKVLIKYVLAKKRSPFSFGEEKIEPPLPPPAILSHFHRINKVAVNTIQMS